MSQDFDKHDDDAEMTVLTCAAVYLLRADGTCYACKRSTPMFGLMALPPLSQEADDSKVDEDDCMLREVVDMPVGLEDSLQQIAGEAYRPDFSRTADLTYWMNHCEHCDATQGDFFVHGPNGPFWPNDEAQMDAIHATRLEGPFRFVDPQTAYSGAMIDWRDRKHGVTRPPPPITHRKKRTPKAGI
jgi:hypothetical protein